MGGAFPITSPAGGTSFQFAGFTAAPAPAFAPITRIVFSSYEASPNQNIVLDNFALASQLEVRVTDIHTTNNGVQISWNTIAGKTNFVQAAANVSDTNSNFADLSGP